MKNTLSKTITNLLTISLLFSGLIVTSYSQALEIDLSKLTGDTQQKFKNISKDIHPLIAYDDSQPAVSKSGLIPFGFEIGINASQITLKSAEELKSIGFDQSNVILPRVYAEFNVFSFGIAATHTPLYSDASITGYKLKYSILDGSAFWPALSLNIHHSSINGIKTLESNTLGYNLGISKGLAFLTAYANIGISNGTFTPKTSSELNLTEVTSEETDLVLGLRLGLPFSNIGVQLRSLGQYNISTINLGVNF